MTRRVFVWGVGAQRVRGYGCTSNAPTSHKQNGDPRSDLKPAAVGHATRQTYARYSRVRLSVL